MSAPAPLRHYFVGDPDTRRTCARNGCARPPTDAVHLEPGDEDAYHAAIKAASGGRATPRTPEQDDAAIERAATRNAARWTHGTNSGTTITGPRFTERHAPDARSTPPRAG